MAFQISSPLEGIEGVYWTMIMHSLLLIVNCFTIRTALAEYRKAKTRFWTGCLIVSCMLLAPSMHGIMLGFQVVTELLGRAPYLPIIGNSSARIGMLVVTLLRLYRFRVISEHPKRQRKFIMHSTMVSVFMLTATITNLMWVVGEELNWHLTNGNQDGAPPSLLLVRNIEGIFGFFAFFLTAAFNVVADYWFVRTILDIRKGAMGDAIVKQGKLVFVKTYLAYIPTLIHFIICTVLGSLFISGSPANTPKQGSVNSRAGKRSKGSINSGKHATTLVAASGTTSGVGRGGFGPTTAHVTLIGNEAERQSTISESPSDRGSLSSQASIVHKK